MDGTQIPDNRVHPTVIRGNPIAHEELNFYITPTAKSGEDQDDVDQMEIEVNQHMLKKIDADSGTFTYVLNEGQPNMTVFVITRESFIKTAPASWLDAI